MYKWLEKIALIAVPFAPMIFFGWKVYEEVFELTGSAAVAISAGIVTGIGLEIVGILSGHKAIGFWRIGDIKSAAVPSFIMVAYVAVGAYELRGTIGQVVFFIAPMVYVLVALGEMLESKELSQAEQDRMTNQVKNDDAEHQRKMEIAKLKLSHEARLERIKQKSAAKATAQKRSDNAHLSAHLPNDWRLLTNEQKARLIDYTSGEIAKMHGISESSARRWKQKANANGVVK